jgi:hypothetical protein
METLRELVSVLMKAIPALFLAGGIAVAVRFRGASRILGAIGFGLLFLVSAEWNWRKGKDLLLHDPDLAPLLFEPEFFPRVLDPDLVPFVHLTELGAWCLVVLSLFLVRTSAAARSAPAPAPLAPPVGGVPVVLPTRAPGWGLAGTWIALSSLSWIAGFAYLALVLEAGSRISSREMEVILPVGILWFLLLVPAVIIYLVWLYRSWESVPPAYRSTSPGKAVGFLFIPFFNIYWVFRAVPGLSASIRRARVAAGSGGGSGFGIGVAAAVISVIPYVNMLAWPFFLIWVIAANGARNRMLAETAAPAAPPPLP